MSFSISIHVDTAKLEEIAAKSGQTTRQIIESAGKEVESYAKSFSRVDTGAMKSGWQSEMTGDMTARISNDVEYTIYNEFGTYKMSAQPMLTPAMEMIAPKLLSPATWMPLFK